MSLTVDRDRLPLREVFTISRGSKTEAQVLTVTVARDGATGRGECVPYARYGENLETVSARIAGLPEGITRAALQTALPPGRRATRSIARCGIRSKTFGKACLANGGPCHAATACHGLYAFAR